MKIIYTILEAEKELSDLKGCEVKIEDIDNKAIVKTNTKQDYWTIKEVNKKTSEILKDCRKKFEVYFYNEDTIDKEFPIPKVLTCRKFKANVEADEDLKNMSANDLKEKGIEGITIRERLLLELQYFNETGKHLDINRITLCSGSRYLGGDVPRADWNSDYGKLRVYWYFTDYASDFLRARAVVS